MCRCIIKDVSVCFDMNISVRNQVATNQDHVPNLIVTILRYCLLNFGLCNYTLCVTPDPHCVFTRETYPAIAEMSPHAACIRVE